MSALSDLLPRAKLAERDRIRLELPIDQLWNRVRHLALGDTPLIRGLFAVRGLPRRLLGKREEGDEAVRIDALVSTPARPGFGLLVDDPPNELVVGAIGKVWHLDIPFVHVPDAEAFTEFSLPDYVKVAWAIRLDALGAHRTELTFELRVDTTDEASWKKFRRYFSVIGVGSHLIRRSLLRGLVRDFGTPAAAARNRPLPGDELLPAATAQETQAVTIAAPPDAVWPWLVQMGCRRGGFYAIDALDNGGLRSAREVHPELQKLRVGDVLPATPRGEDGFEVVGLEPKHKLILGGLYDVEAGQQLKFDAPRPSKYWHVTWSFVLEAVEGQTRVSARARAAFPPSGRLHAIWIRRVHRQMQRFQLRHLKARVEGRLPRDDWRDVAEGLGGAAVIASALATPFLRPERSQWGLDAADVARTFPGDELIAAPSWSYTHGIEIHAPAHEVWPWIAQLGADRGGFYSYQWLENVAGSGVRNAETVRAHLELEEGSGLLLHPKVPPFRIETLVPGQYFVARSAPSPVARATGKGWVEVSWLFFLETPGRKHCRLISRYRCRHADDLATRFWFGPTLIEPVSFAMDRQLLLGVKQRAEAAYERPEPRRKLPLAAGRAEPRA